MFTRVMMRRALTNPDYYGAVDDPPRYMPFCYACRQALLSRRNMIELVISFNMPDARLRTRRR